LQPVTIRKYVETQTLPSGKTEHRNYLHSVNNSAQEFHRVFDLEQARQEKARHEKELQRNPLQEEARLEQSRRDKERHARQVQSQRDKARHAQALQYETYRSGIQAAK
jgi:hypothetical protein